MGEDLKDWWVRRGYWPCPASGVWGEMCSREECRGRLDDVWECARLRGKDRSRYDDAIEELAAAWAELVKEEDGGAR